ncbi:MAG: C25 family cysteine peptidase [Planctomycetota bacterium]
MAASTVTAIEKDSRPMIGVSLYAAVLLIAAAPDTLVVCPDAWRGAMQEWTNYRQSQGREIRFVSPAKSAEVTKRRLQHAAAKETPRWIVLVGDAAGEHESSNGQTTPTWFADAEVNCRWGSEKTLATDLLYARLDEQGSALVCLGRIPADTADELQAYLSRVIAYEQRTRVDVDEHRINIVAAPGNFSPLLDRVIDATAANLLTQLTPPACELRLTYADWRSPFCPYPPAMPAAVAQGLQQRSLAWIYLGHGHRQSLDVLRTPLGYAKLLDNRLAQSLDGGQFPPLAAMIACYTGAFDGDQDCLAEELLRQPGGPLTVLAGSRVTMPYGNSVLGLELLTDLFAGDTTTVGEMLAQAKARAITSTPASEATDAYKLRQTIEAIAVGFTADALDRKQELVEHVQMYNLLGDPLLRLRRPAPLLLSILPSDSASGHVRIVGASPIAGECCLQIKRRHREAAMIRGNRNEFQLDAETQASYEAAYQEANPPAVVEETFDIDAGSFTVELPYPPGNLADYVLVGSVAGDKQLAVGHATLKGEPSRMASSESETNRK